MTTTTQLEINTNAGSLDNGAIAITSTSSSSTAANGDIVITNAGHNNNNIPVNHATSGSTHNVGALGNTQRAADSTKRKKLKSRSATAAATNNITTLPHNKHHNKSSSNNDHLGLNYSKDHLDAWLENCLRDATNAQLSSSSEFLDFNPTSHKQQQQQIAAAQLQQQQQQAQLQAPPAMPNLPTFQNAAGFNPQQQPQQQHQLLQQTLPHQLAQQQQQQQQFLMRSHSQPYNMGASVAASGTASPFSLGIQRHAPSYVKHSQSTLSHRYPMLFPPQSNGGGVNGFVGFGLPHNHGDGTQDFASLPPLVNMMGGFGAGSEHEQNSTDVLDGSGSNPNISRGFRFSDPCLLNPSDNDSKLSGHNTPDPRNGTGSTELEQQNKFFAALMEQINILHETNSKICRNLHETKVDIEALKHAPNSQQQWGGGMRHRRDSLSGLSTQSQPLVFGGGFGTHSPAPTFHSGAYTPGMMTDVVREVKEAARVREDALLNRVKSMVEERQWSMNEGNVRILRDIDELKSHVLQLRLERKDTNKRLTHLEAENKYLRQALASCYNNRNHDIIYENERMQRQRKPFPNGSGARRAQSFNLHYGTVHQTHSLEEDDEVELAEQQQTQAEALDESELQPATTNKRHSIGSNESRSNGQPTPAAQQNQQIQQQQQVDVVPHSPPTFALLQKSANEQSPPPPLLPRKKEHVQLKRELNEAAAARKEANQRIIALEKLVKDLSATVAHAAANNNNNNCNSHNNLTNGGRKNQLTAASLDDADDEEQLGIGTIQNWSKNMAQAPASKFSVAGGPITDL